MKKRTHRDWGSGRSEENGRRSGVKGLGSSLGGSRLPLPALLPVRGKPGSESSMYKLSPRGNGLCGLCPHGFGGRRIGGGPRAGPGRVSLGQQRRLEGAVPGAVPRGQHFAGEMMQRVVGFCKVMELSPSLAPQDPSRARRWGQAPLKHLCLPPSRPAPVPFNFCWMA